MFNTVSMFLRRAVAYPLVAFGFMLTMIAEGFIRAGAWLVNVEVYDE